MIRFYSIKEKESLRLACSTKDCLQIGICAKMLNADLLVVTVLGASQCGALPVPQAVSEDLLWSDRLGACRSPRSPYCSRKFFVQPQKNFMV